MFFIHSLIEGLFVFFLVNDYWFTSVMNIHLHVSWNTCARLVPGYFPKSGIAVFKVCKLEKEMATYSSVLAWRIPGTAEPDGLLSMGSHRVGHYWSDLAAAAVLYGSLNFEKVTDQFFPYELWFIEKIILHSWSLNNINLNWACPLICRYFSIKA